MLTKSASDAIESTQSGSFHVFRLTDAASWAARVAVHRAGPVAAERQVDDKPLRTKLAVDVALIAGEVGSRSSELGSVDVICAVADKIWHDAVTVIEPDVDLAGTALDNVPTTSVGIESGSVRVGFVRHLDTASSVALGGDVAVSAKSGASSCVSFESLLLSKGYSPSLSTTPWHGATCRGVESGSVRALVIDALQDVNLSLKLM